uniref:Uncharacterized protein n=1 Tax=Sus scrofa TaxID=9823 RepID=A0A8D0WBW0_PIG
MTVPIYSPTNSIGGFPFLTPSPAFIICRFLMIAILTSVRWNFTVVSIFVFLIISEDEHLFMCLLAICMYSSEKCLFRSSAHFSIELVFFLSCMHCLYILEINPLSVALFANIFSQSLVGCLFILFMVFFDVQKLITFIGSHLFISAFISITLGDLSKKILM